MANAKKFAEQLSLLVVHPNELKQRFDAGEHVYYQPITDNELMMKAKEAGLTREEFTIIIQKDLRNRFEKTFN